MYYAMYTVNSTLCRSGKVASAKYAFTMQVVYYTLSTNQRNNGSNMLNKEIGKVPSQMIDKAEVIGHIIWDLSIQN